LTRARGILLHVDTAQSAGKIPIDVRTTAADLMSFSAHKIYGPKGIGALYVRHNPRVRLEPQIQGAGHEQALRAGTLPTHQIVGMGVAFKIAAEEMQEEDLRITALRERLWLGLQSLPHVYLNGDPVQRLPGNLNVSFPAVDFTELQQALSQIAIST